MVKLNLNKLVVDYDFENTRFRVQDRQSSPTKQPNGVATNGASGHASEGEWVDADVILAADGVKSKARGKMLGRKGEVDEGEIALLPGLHDAKETVEDTGQAAYRILVRRDMISEDPELIPFFEGSHSYRWIGERRHIIVSLDQ